MQNREKYTGIYASWYAMKQRCGNSNNEAFKNYGGRGITYPEKWEEFAGFEKEMKDDYKKGLTIERIDNNKSYSRKNCKWATRKEQNNNKRSNIVLTFDDKAYPIAIWAEILGINYWTIRSRFCRGKRIEQILKSQN